MTANEIRETVKEINFRDWVFGVSGLDGDLWLQVMFHVDGKEWAGRKWKLSHWMTKSEIVQTALKAVLTAAEHEAREYFLYRDRAVFGPHINIDNLWAICEGLDARKSN